MSFETFLEGRQLQECFRNLGIRLHYLREQREIRVTPCDSMMVLRCVPNIPNDRLLQGEDLGRD